MILFVELHPWRKAYRLPLELCWREIKCDYHELKSKIITEHNAKWTQEEFNKYPNTKATDVEFYSESLYPIYLFN